MQGIFETSTSTVYVLLYSGGLDSTFVLQKLLEEDKNVVAVHAVISRETLISTLSNALKVSMLVRRTFPLVLVEHNTILREVKRLLRVDNLEEYTCIVCKYLMLFETHEIIGKLGINNLPKTVIVTGETLGQVASQTLPNLLITHLDLNIPVVTPLLGCDKHEASNLIADKVMKTPPCPYIPKKVVTRADPVLAKLVIDSVISKVSKLISSIGYHVIIV